MLGLDVETLLSEIDINVAAAFARFLQWTFIRVPLF